MLNYHYVAFIDILGFSSMVQSDCDGPQSEILFLPKLLEAYDRATNEAQQNASMTVKQFSDAVVLAQLYSPDAFSQFINQVIAFQLSLLIDGVLCRGGVSYGKHYEKANFVFSDALIKAYRIESARANYPRIVVDDDLMDLLTPTGVVRSASIVREADGSRFLDYLRNCNRDQGLEAIRALTDGWEAEPVRVREKLRWLREYFSFSFPGFGDLDVRRFKRE